MRSNGVFLREVAEPMIFSDCLSGLHVEVRLTISQSGPTVVLRLFLPF